MMSITPHARAYGQRLRHLAMTATHRSVVTSAQTHAVPTMRAPTSCSFIAATTVPTTMLASSVQPSATTTAYINRYVDRGLPISSALAIENGLSVGRVVPEPSFPLMTALCDAPLNVLLNPPFHSKMAHFHVDITRADTHIGIHGGAMIGDDMSSVPDVVGDVADVKETVYEMLSTLRRKKKKMKKHKRRKWKRKMRSTLIRLGKIKQ